MMSSSSSTFTEWFETVSIAALEEYCADWENSYYYTKNYNVTCPS
jgi:hypothetical protein